jgi:hypothetical protein
MNVEFITIRENGFRSFEEKCRELWKEGWKPLFPHTAHMRVEKKDGSVERFWNFYDIYTQQWTRTTHPKLPWEKDHENETLSSQF